MSTEEKKPTHKERLLGFAFWVVALPVCYGIMWLAFKALYWLFKTPHDWFPINIIIG